MSWFKPATLLDKTYEIGILLKGIDGLLEMLGGILLLVVKPSTITGVAAFLTQRELSHDPHDFIANHILLYARDLAQGSHVFAVVFLLTHGLVKIVLVAALLRNYRWAYPFALITLGLFVVYQLYRMVIEPTWGMGLLTALDLIIIWLIWREWGQQRIKWHKMADEAQS